jgi:transposase
MDTFISRDKKVEIITLSKEGKSIREIVKSVQVPRSSVQRIVQNNKFCFGLMRIKGSEKSFNLNASLSKIISKAVETSPEKTATRHLLAIKEDTGVIIKKRSFINYLHVLGFKSRSSIKKPLLKKTHITNRLNACKELLFE